MTRPTSKDAWDFIEVGKLYQYKEDSLILIVEILEDNSINDAYKFKLRPIAGNLKFQEYFNIMHSKNFNGIYSGMMQFYKVPEYIPLPIGSSWPYIFNKHKLDIFNQAHGAPLDPQDP